MLKKKIFLSLGVSLLALCACKDNENVEKITETVIQTTPESEIDRILASPEVQANANIRLDNWFETKFEETVREYPQYLAQLGIRQRMDEWNDPSRSFRLEQLEKSRLNLEELRATFDPADLDANHKLSYDLYVKGIEDDLAGAQWDQHGYPFNQMFGAHSGVAAFLINNHKIKSVEDARNYIARLNGIDEYLGTHIANANASAEMGIQPPTFVYDQVINAAQTIITGAPFDDGNYSTLMNDFQKKVEALNLDDITRKALYEEAVTALLTSVKPAYESVIETMNTQKANSTTDDGVWKLPDGEAYYAHRLKMMTTTDLTADEIHAIGLSEVARIQNEMRDIMKSVGFEGDLQAFFTYLQTDPKFTYEDSDEGREAYLRDATAIIDTMKGELDSVFLRKPKADLEVKRVEPFREKAGGKAFYNRPAADGSRPGYYYANLYKITDMPKYQMEALAYHEGIPGHHMQIAISQELEGIPKFRKFGSYTAFTEGWGLYSEYLPKEMGFYQDPYSDFGRLAMEIWRAARLVVDTGIHHKKWTREEAIKYLTDNTPNPENDCRKAIERYIVMPGQATAYKIGMLKILEERARSKAELGEEFDIREFHDVILASGPIPLDVFENQVTAWIEKKKTN